MLFHITQTHSPENCPRDEGGPKDLYNPDAEGITLKAMYGAHAEHVMFYVVEAENVYAVNRFLMPGFKKCNSKITVVSEEEV